MSNLFARCFLWSVIVACPAMAQNSPIRPDPQLTPGVANQPPTALELLCTAGHTKITRHVTAGTKKAVFREYGIDPKTLRRGTYEVDHLIPLALDGSNDIKNLWPESYLTQPLNAHKKDDLEDTLHRMVCKHEIALAAAQTAIATDWVAAYNQYVLHHSP